MVNTPRTLGMGNTFIAVSDDDSAALGNPAGLALIRDGMVSVGNLGVTKQEDHWYSAYIVPSSSDEVQGMALSMSKTKDKEKNTRLDRSSWSAGQYYSEGVAVGLNLQYLRASDDTTGTKGTAFGVNLGVLYQLPAPPGGRSPGTIGLLVQNPNEPKILGVKQPRVISVGVAMRPSSGLLVAADAYNVLNEAGAQREESAGIELEPVPGICLRGGYLNEAGIYTLGAGIKGNSFHLDAGWASKDGGNDETAYVGMSFIF